ncbi:MAG: RDD family protein [Luteolibacter sp.]|uniref:RDD family protein n=1 Tax=Luteolibacter sp. TaxID=1962973 RepID=UPI0032656B8D
MEIYVAKSGHETGPFTREQIPSMLESGMLDLTDNLWHQGLSGWIPIHQFLNVRPPVPGSLRREAAEGYISRESGSRTGEPAPFGRRALAFLIDSAICGGVTFVVVRPIAEFAASSETSSAFMLAIQIAVVLLLVVIPSWIYCTLWECSPKQATLGKIACGLMVTTMDGNRLKFAQAGKRSIGKIASEAVCGLVGFGFLFGTGILNASSPPLIWTPVCGALFLTSLRSPKKQCIHDVRAGTLVVMK